MKKLGIILGLGIVLCLNSVAAEIVTTEHLQYAYIDKRGGCTKLTLDEKGKILDWIRRGVLVVNKQLVNDAGTYTWMEGDDNIQIDTMTSYGECKAYEIIVVNKKDINNWEPYKNMKDPALNVAKK